MMGLVLWCDLNDQKAVFWCEDHGDLAFYDASQEVAADFGLLGAGDMVKFDVTLQSKIRRAHNACLVEQKVCNGLQDKLRQSAEHNGSEDKPEAKTGKVLQFSRHFANPLPYHQAGNG